MAEINTEDVKVHTVKLTERELAAWRRAAEKALDKRVEEQDGDAEIWLALTRLGLPPLRRM
jgi:hypothetical protein